MAPKNHPAAQLPSDTVRRFVRNPVSLRLRKIYCLAGAEFCRPDLEAAWKEIERLTDAGRGLMEVYIAADEASVEENGRKWDAAHSAFYANDPANPAVQTRRDDTP